MVLQTTETTPAQVYLAGVGPCVTIQGNRWYESWNRADLDETSQNPPTLQRTSHRSGTGGRLKYSSIYGGRKRKLTRFTIKDSNASDATFAPRCLKVSMRNSGSSILRMRSGGMHSSIHGLIKKGFRSFFAHGGSGAGGHYPRK